MAATSILEQRLHPDHITVAPDLAALLWRAFAETASLEADSLKHGLDEALSDQSDVEVGVTNLSTDLWRRFDRLQLAQSVIAELHFGRVRRDLDWPRLVAVAAEAHAENEKYRKLAAIDVEEWGSKPGTSAPLDDVRGHASDSNEMTDESRSVLAFLAPLATADGAVALDISEREADALVRVADVAWWETVSALGESPGYDRRQADSAVLALALLHRTQTAAAAMTFPSGFYDRYHLREIASAKAAELEAEIATVTGAVDITEEQSRDLDPVWRDLEACRTVLALVDPKAAPVAETEMKVAV